MIFDYLPEELDDTHEQALNELLEESSFPHEGLPSILNSIHNESARLFGVDSAISVTAALSAIAGSIGKGVVIRNEPHETPANFYALILANSGAAKSSAVGRILKPLYDLQTENILKYETVLLPDLKAQLSVREKRKRKLEQSKDESSDDDLVKIIKQIEKLKSEMVEPRLIIEDATSQVLAMQLARNSEQLSSVSFDAAEVADILLGRYHSNGSTEDGLYLKAFTGEPYTQDRVTRAPVRLSAPCLNLLWVCTPDLEDRFFEQNRLVQGGFLPRMLIARSESKLTHDDGHDKRPIKELWTMWEMFLRQNFEKYRNRPHPVMLEFSKAAQDILINFHNTGIDESKLLPAVQAFKLRKREHASRLSISLHLAACHNQNVEKEISCETVLLACKLVDFYQAPAILMMQGHQLRKDDKTFARILEIAKGETKVTLRDLKRAGLKDGTIEDFAKRNPKRCEMVIIKPQGTNGGRPSPMLMIKNQ